MERLRHITRRSCFHQLAGIFAEIAPASNLPRLKSANICVRMLRSGRKGPLRIITRHPLLLPHKFVINAQLVCRWKTLWVTQQPAFYFAALLLRRASPRGMVLLSFEYLEFRRRHRRDLFHRTVLYRYFTMYPTFKCWLKRWSMCYSMTRCDPLMANPSWWHSKDEGQAIHLRYPTVLRS